MGFPRVPGEPVSYLPAVHKDVWAIACDNHIIGKDGAERIHKSPREIIVV
jgi:hypothetical protein